MIGPVWPRGRPGIKIENLWDAKTVNFDSRAPARGGGGGGGGRDSNLESLVFKNAKFWFPASCSGRLGQSARRGGRESKFRLFGFKNVNLDSRFPPRPDWASRPDKTGNQHLKYLGSKSAARCGPGIKILSLWYPRALNFDSRPPPRASRPAWLSLASLGLPRPDADRASKFTVFGIRKR